MQYQSPYEDPPYLLNMAEQYRIELASRSKTRSIGFSEHFVDCSVACINGYWYCSVSYGGDVLLDIDSRPSIQWPRANILMMHGVRLETTTEYIHAMIVQSVMGLIRGLRNVRQRQNR